MPRLAPNLERSLEDPALGLVNDDAGPAERAVGPLGRSPPSLTIAIVIAVGVGSVV